MADPTTPDERAVYADLLGWLLDHIAEAVEAIPPPLLDRPPYEGAAAAGAIAAHVHGATVAWALGIGAGQDVSRDRVAEFASAGGPAADLAAGLATLDPARLSEVGPRRRASAKASRTRCQDGAASPPRSGTARSTSGTWR